MYVDLDNNMTIGYLTREALSTEGRGEKEEEKKLDAEGSITSNIVFIW